MKVSKRITSLVCTAVLVLGISPVFAAKLYKDVSDEYWAAKDIVKCSECKVFEGYGDGTFKPAGNITQEQTLAVLYRTIKYNNSSFDETDYSEEYPDALAGMGVSNWAKINMAYALKSGFVTESDFAKYNAAKPAYRIDIGVWTAKALQYELSALSILPYSDTAKIDAADFAYIDALYRHAIMRGNADGSFGSADYVTRAQMAAISSRLLKEKENGNSLTKENLLGYGCGSIETVNTQRRTILLKSEEKTYTLRIAEDAVILLDGKKTDITALSLMRGITASFSSVAGASNTVLIQTKPSLLKGTVDSVSNYADFVLVNLKDENNISISLAADPSIAKDLSAGRSISYISDGAQLLSWN